MLHFYLLRGVKIILGFFISREENWRVNIIVHCVVLFVSSRSRIYKQVGVIAFEAYREYGTFLVDCHAFVYEASINQLFVLAESLRADSACGKICRCCLQILHLIIILFFICFLSIL